MKKSEKLAAEQVTVALTLLREKMAGKITKHTILESAKLHNKFLEALWCEQEETEAIHEYLANEVKCLEEKIKKLERGIKTN